MAENNQKPNLLKMLFGTILGSILLSLIGGGAIIAILLLGLGEIMNVLGVIHRPTEEDLLRVSIPATTEVYFSHATDYSAIQNFTSRGPSMDISVTAKDTGEIIPISKDFDARIYYQWEDGIGGYRKAVFVIPEPGVYIVELTSSREGVVLLWPFIDQNSRRSRIFRSALLLIVGIGVVYFIRSAYRPRDVQVANDKAAQWKKMMDDRAASQKK